MTKRYIIMGCGSPSDAAAFEKSYDSLGGTINDYLTRKGILHPKSPLLVSCHRTLKRAVSYALESELLAAGPVVRDSSKEEERRVVVILFGGLSFALPGIFSSETMTIPILGVPVKTDTHGGGLDSATAVYNLPPGTVVGGLPLHTEENPSLDKAVLLAEKILGFSDSEVSVVCEDDKDASIAKGMKAVDELLNGPEGCAASKIKGAFDIKHKHSILPKGGKGRDFEIALNIARDNGHLIDCDRSSRLALQCIIPESSMKGRGFEGFAETLKALLSTKNTLYFGNSTNAALFMLRVLALSDKRLKESILAQERERKEGSDKKYGPKLSIDDGLFI